MSSITERLGFETLQVHAGQEFADTATGARAIPIYQTAAYVFDSAADAEARFSLKKSGNIYGRLTNPTQEALEKRIAALEGSAAALAVASGAAAITYAIMNIARQGDHIVAGKNIYGGTYNLLAHTLNDYGISVTFVDIYDLDAIEKAIGHNTKGVMIETLGNPNSDVADIEAVADIAHKHGVPLIVDNTFGTPYIIRPIEHGADIVVHSATKFIGGHGSSLGGVIVDAGRFDWSDGNKFEQLTRPEPGYHGMVFTDIAGQLAYIARIRATLLRDMGAAISPFNAFMLMQGLETLSLRVEKHINNTLKIVDFLNGHPYVECVSHPSLPTHRGHAAYKKYFTKGAGSIFTFNIKGGKKETFRLIDNLKIFSLLANVAETKSLVIHPASTTHSQLTAEEKRGQGIGDNTIRLSVGIEDAGDLIRDLAQALESAI